MARMIFIDSANKDEIQKWKTRGIVRGVTMNQKILLQEKNTNFKKLVLEICQNAKIHVSIELTEYNSVARMVKEAKKYAGWSRYIVIKVPVTTDGIGLEVIAKLHKLGIKTNATLMVSFEQMLLAISAGANFVSIFYNRAKDVGYDPIEIINRSRDFIDKGGYKSQIISGSIRNIRDVGNAFAAGSDIVTVPPKILDEMLQEKMTQKTLEEFNSAWEEYKKL